MKPYQISYTIIYPMYGYYQVKTKKNILLKRVITVLFIRHQFVEELSQLQVIQLTMSFQFNYQFLLKQMLIIGQREEWLC